MGHEEQFAAPYIAVISAIEEVVLLGNADLAFWQRELAHSVLTPVPRAGRAQLMLSAPRLRWGGIRFHELSLAVVVDHPQAGADAGGLYLAGAYNSSRLLAFLERALFTTPYEHQSLQIETKLPASIAVAHGADVSLHAAMAQAPSPLWSRDECWEGPIFLPSQRGSGTGQRWFHARISGPTRAYRAAPTADTFVVRPPAENHLLSKLADSGFVLEEWRIRTGATHARSRTYQAPPGR